MTSTGATVDLDRERREAERAQREKEAHNQGINRGGYDNLFRHTRYYWQRKQRQLAKRLFESKAHGHFLELGSSSWEYWIENVGVRPAQITCINISETELQIGIDRSKRTANKPKFMIMNANKLEFPDNTFDVVYGTGILHHLDYERAIKEIWRVLKPGGMMVFLEPLALNPVSWMVRVMTPHLRTPDETPLGLRELGLVRSMFNTKFHYEEFFSVPAGLISKLLFRRPDNPLTQAVFWLDEMIVKVFPFVGPIYRNVVFEARKPGATDDR